MKIAKYNLSFVTQEMIDFTDDVTSILNFGKYQLPVITSGTGPTWVGRQGEMVFMVTTGTNRLYICNSDLSSTSWVAVAG